MPFAVVKAMGMVVPTVEAQNYPLRGLHEERRRIWRRGGPACAKAVVHEGLHRVKCVLVSPVGITAAVLRRYRVLLQPREQRLAVCGQDVLLVRVHVQVKEAGHDDAWPPVFVEI